VKIPRVRERVMIVGRDGIFLVVGVDRVREVADLIPVREALNLEEDVPFAGIRPSGNNHRSSAAD
jgi:hypothetical protein